MGAAWHPPSAASLPEPDDPIALEDVPGFRHVGWELDEELFDREERAREVLTQQCMADLGLPYAPVVSLRVPAGSPALSQELVNPNDTYVAGLDTEQREAYFVALYGVEDPFSPVVRPHPTGPGCAGASFELVPSVYALAASLGDELEGVRLAVEASPEVAEADRMWQVCAGRAVAGLDARSPSDLAAQIDASADMRPEAPLRDLEGCDRQRDAAVQQVRSTVEEAFVDRHRDALVRHTHEVVERHRWIDEVLGEV